MDSVETKASAKYIRISPRKARLVVDLIRGRDVADAQQILDYSPKAAARVVGKILNSAIANAEHNNKLDPDELYVCRAYVDEGPTLKRFRPRAMGRATRINKRTSHITLVLDEREPRAEAKRKRFRRPVRKKAAAEPEMAPEAQRGAEPQQADADEDELDADTATAEPQQAEDDRTELNADTKAKADKPELNADTEAEEAEADTKAKHKPKDTETKAKKTKKADDSESED